MKGIQLAVLFGISFAVVSAHAVDYDEYRNLKDRANLVLETIETASPHAVLGLREAAVDADLALIQWLEEFFASEEFAQISDEQRTAVHSDRYRWEYNLSVQLMALERCEEASERIGSLLGEAFSDEELRPLLAETYQEAVQCAMTPVEPDRTAVTVQSETPGAEVLIDGALVGAAPASLDVEEGEHTAVVRADGFTSQTIVFVAQGDSMSLGPVTLQAVVVAPPPQHRNSPEWYEWTMWGVGMGGIGSFVGCIVAARNREDTLEGPPPGGQARNPPQERETIDKLDRAAYITGALGLAAAITGTLLYVLSGPDEPEPRVSFGVEPGRAPSAFVMFRF